MNIVINFLCLVYTGTYCTELFISHVPKWIKNETKFGFNLFPVQINDKVTFNSMVIKVGNGFSWNISEKRFIEKFRDLTWANFQSSTTLGQKQGWSNHEVSTLKLISNKWEERIRDNWSIIKMEYWSWYLTIWTSLNTSQHQAA